MAVDAEAKRLGRVTIGQADTVDPHRFQQSVIAAIQRLQRAVAEYPVAVLDIVAAAIRGVEQRIVPIGVEQTRQGMRPDDG